MSKKNKNRCDDYKKPNESRTDFGENPVSEVEPQSEIDDPNTTNELKPTDDDNVGKSVSKINGTLALLFQEVKLLSSQETTDSSNIKTLQKSVNEFKQNISDILSGLVSSSPKKIDLDFAEQNIKNKIQNLDNNVKSNLSYNVGVIKKYIDDGGKGVATSVTKSVTDLTDLVKKKFDGQNNNQNNNHSETLGKLSTIKEKVEEISQSTEVMQSLPKKIDDISAILSDKGLQLKQDFPAVSHDEETLAELAECGEKILQQLAIAARWYARKLPEINAHEHALKNLSATKDREKDIAEENGKELGRKAVVKELLARYDDIYKLMSGNPDGAEKRLKILSTFLTNQGVEQIYQVDEELEITEENLMNFEPYFNNLQPGKIIVTSPAYTFDSQIIAKATYDFAKEIETEQEEHEEHEEHEGHEEQE